MDPLEKQEKQVVPSSKYNLSVFDENFHMEIETTLEIKDHVGIHSVKFNYNDQYVAAGYRDEMENFLAVNPGLASRFSHKMHIDDYTADELSEIYIKMASKDNYKLSDEAKSRLLDVTAHMVYNKNKNFGNAREMRNLLDSTIQQLSLRVSLMSPSEVTQETYQLILPEDIKE